MSIKNTVTITNIKGVHSESIRNLSTTSANGTNGINKPVANNKPAITS